MALGTVQTKQYNSAADATTHSVVFTSGPTQGNLLLCAASSNNVLTMSSAGWTLVASAANNCGTYLWQKIAGASETSTVTVACTGTENAVLELWEKSGNATSPLDKSATSGATSGSVTTCTTGTTAATVQADEWALAIWGREISFGTLSSFTNSFVADLDGTVATTSTVKVSNGGASKALVATGTVESTATFSIAATAPNGLVATFKALVVPPTRIQHAETVWNTTTTPKTTSVTVQTGDVIAVAVVGADGAAVVATPTNDGAALTWTAGPNVGTSAVSARVAVWTATADSNRTIVITDSISGGGSTNWGIVADVFRGSGGVGASGSANGDTTSPFSADVITTQANSAVFVASGDWTDQTGARTYLTTGVGAFTEEAAADVATQYAVRVGYHADVGVTGTKTVGSSAPAAQKVTIVGIEIKGSSGAPPAPPPVPDGTYRYSRMRGARF